MFNFFDEPSESTETGCAIDPFAAAGEPQSISVVRRELVPSAPVRPRTAPFLAERRLLKSQLAVYSGGVAGLPALIDRLAAIMPLAWIVNRPALPEGVDPAVPSPGYLLNWYPESVLARAGAFLTPPESASEFPKLAERIWGQDCLFGVCSPLKHPALLKHLQAAIRGDDGQSAGTPQHVRMYYTPAGARSMLNLGQASLLTPLLAGIAGVLVESERPEQWLLFCSADLDRQVRSWLDS